MLMDSDSKPSFIERLTSLLLREPEDREQLLEILHSAYERNLMDADALTIEGEVSLPLAGNLEPSHVEVQMPRYQRTFTLGKELDSEKVAAEFRHGVLKLSIPKVEHAKPRKIEVQVA